MAITTQTADRVGVAAGTETIVDLKGMWIGLVVLNVFYLIVRIYEQIFGWRAGLNSFAPSSRPIGCRSCGRKFRWSSSRVSALPAICGRRATATSTPSLRVRSFVVLWCWFSG